MTIDGPISIVGGRHLSPDGRLIGATERSEASGHSGSVVTMTGATIETVAGDVVPGGAVTAAAPGTAESLGDGQLVDAAGLIVSPGFIDLQINGGFGVDLLSDPDRLWELAALLPRHGVTGFLPTIISSPPRCTDAAMAALTRRPAGHSGAEPLGLHFEGPMLNPSRAGAHPVRHLVQPHLDLIRDWTGANGVALVTIAPELPGAADVIAELTGRGVVVSAGHSEATAAQTRAAMATGVSMVTHLFNAMSPLGHRNPNLVGVALADDDLAASVIVDGVHLAPDVVAAVWKAKGRDGMVLITDAVAPMGMGPGTYHLAGLTITADDDQVRTEDGTLAGSILTMDGAVRNLVAYTGCEPQDALGAASSTPARVLGADGRGRIEPGATADLVLLDDALQVQATFCRGRLAYVRDAARSRIPRALLDAFDALDGT